jgi:hypothetical protein
MNIIKFYPFSEATLDFAPKPEPSSKFLPSWYKKTPSFIDNDEGLRMGQANATVKKCMPIFDIITAGYIIPLPCDVYLDATNPERLSWSIPGSLLSYQGDMFASHAREQFSEMPIDKNIYHKDLLRIFPFWAVGTAKGYSSLFVQPQYSDDTPLTALQAIVDTDAFVSDGHLSFLVQKGFKGVIKQGTPLVQIIPFKRESWKMDIVSPEESAKKMGTQRLQVRSSFTNSYKNKFRSKKDYS